MLLGIIIGSFAGFIITATAAFLIIKSAFSSIRLPWW